LFLAFGDYSELILFSYYLSSITPAIMGEEEPVLYDERIWLDGCWDFFHHGHAGAMLQARQLGTELYVGVHSDEDILKNKGPTVMNLDERYDDLGIKNRRIALTD
jgi:cytidyltransferase-like protein